MKNWLDVFLVIICVYAIWKGYVRGFLREVMEIIGLIAAFVIANHYSPQFAVYMADNWGMSKNIAIVLSYGVILALVGLATQLIIYVLSAFTHDGVLGVLDSAMGGFVSLAKLILILVIILNLVVLGPFQLFKEPVLQSQWAQYILSLTPGLYDFMMENFPSTWGEQLKPYRDQYVQPDKEPARRI
jgi:membrane protein required for colicin V production